MTPSRVRQSRSSNVCALTLGSSGKNTGKTARRLARSRRLCGASAPNALPIEMNCGVGSPPGLVRALPGSISFLTLTSTFEPYFFTTPYSSREACILLRSLLPGSSDASV